MTERAGDTLRGVETTGPDGSPTVVFVHGAVFQRKMWAPQRDALPPEFRVVTLDLPGHGERSTPDFRMEQALDLLDAVFEAVSARRAVLVGLSLGGYVVTAYTRRNPESVAGVVVSGSSANPVDRLATLTRIVGRVSTLLTRSERLTDRIERRLIDWVRSRPISSDTASEIVEAGFSPRQFGLAGPELAGRDFRAALADYPGPSLVLNGEHDTLLRRGEDKHAAAAQNCRVATIEDAGHVCNLTNPGAYTDAVRQFGRQALSESDPGTPL